MIRNIILTAVVFLVIATVGFNYGMTFADQMAIDRGFIDLDGDYYSVGPAPVSRRGR